MLQEGRMSGGLEGIVAAETVLSHTDPARGMVWVRGHDLPDLVVNHGFEGTVALLWDGFAGEGLTRVNLTEAFGNGRTAASGGWTNGFESCLRPIAVRGRADWSGVPTGRSPHRSGLVGAMTVIVAGVAAGREWPTAPSRLIPRCPPRPICCACGVEPIRSGQRSRAGHILDRHGRKRR